MKLNSMFAGGAGLIGATGRVTRGSYGRKNGYIYVDLEDKQLVDKHLHGSSDVIVLPTEIDHFPRGRK